MATAKPETINSFPSPRPGHYVRMDVTPHDSIVSVSSMYDKYTYREIKVHHPDDPNRIAVPGMYYHETGIELEFSAIVVEPMIPVVMEEWYWDFGDGVYASGNPVHHTYHHPNPGTIAHVRARGDDGTLSYASMNLMLRAPAEGPPPPPN